MKISVTLFEQENQYIASCPELEINCYGADKAEAARRIRDVLTFYIRSAEELGLEVEKFDNVSIEGFEMPLPRHAWHSAPESVN
jgi:predicted RNase H-like HicB family nuclease